MPRIELVPIVLQAEGWGDIKLMRALPREGDYWGVLGCFRGTSWESLVNVLPGKEFSYALYGHPWPLLRHLGPDPVDLPRRLGEKDKFCGLFQDKSCAFRNEKRCVLGGIIPPCFEAPGIPPRFREVAYDVAVAIKDDYRIVVVEGETFSL